jgi:hypothetical protein
MASFKDGFTFSFTNNTNDTIYLLAWNVVDSLVTDGVLYDAVSSSEYLVPNGDMVSE